jgi:hypothetical protein
LVDLSGIPCWANWSHPAQGRKCETCPCQSTCWSRTVASKQTFQTIPATTPEAKVTLANIGSCKVCKSHPQRPCPNRQPNGQCVVYMVDGYWRMSATTTPKLEQHANEETQQWVYAEQWKERCEHPSLINYV